jgi:hypothetical protein
MIDVKIAFYFQAKYRRRSQRKSRTKFFKGESTLPIRQKDRGDVHVAYRFPAGPGEARKTEVLLFEEKLWWPMSFDGIPGHATLAQLQAKLLDHDFDLLGIGPRPPFELASTPFNDPSISRVWWDATDEALARAYQKITENVMICDGVVYALGGEPVYVPASASSASKSWSALAPCFVNPGKDRAIDPCRGGLRWQPGGFTTDEVQACLRNGAFFALRHARRLPCDTRNLLGELEISTKALDSLDPLELQVDACVREIWRLVHSTAWAFAGFFLSRDPDREPTKRVLQAIALDLFDKAASVKPHQSSQDEITLGRAAAIEEFVAFVDRSGLNFHRPDLMIECRQMIERLDRPDCPARAQALCKFTTEEEQAVASLAQSINDAPRGREDHEGPDVHDPPRA